MSRRRRPVPVEWRFEHHELDVRSHVAGGGWGGRPRTYRARGRCACGEQWNAEYLPDGTRSRSDTWSRDDVIEAWKDHVEEAYYSQPSMAGASDNNPDR